MAREIKFRPENQFDHKERHAELHKCLDELLADFIGHTHRLPSKTTILELVEWSNQQQFAPTGTET